MPIGYPNQLVVFIPSVFISYSHTHQDSYDWDSSIWFKKIKNQLALQIYIVQHIGHQNLSTFNQPGYKIMVF